MSSSVRRLLLTLALLAAGCHRPPAEAIGPLPQRGYLWQRDWTPAVASALAEAQQKMNGVIVLGAEILWLGATPEVVRANIPWATLAKASQPVSIALRIAPFAGPFAPDDLATRTIIATAQSLLAAAAAHGVKVVEFQIDFDCAQKKLAGYRVWIETLHRKVSSPRLVITTLPAWLDEPEFSALLRQVDSYVLQVHSVPTRKETGRDSLCDPALARKWVAEAAALGFPFSVALPTYRCLAGYAPTGQLLGVVMDSVQPAWPPDTTVLEFSTSANEMADLVKGWQASRPVGMRELIWYRIPVATDQFNWRWPTLLAVMAGRHPAHHLEVQRDGDNPIDLSVVNTGEADETLAGTVTASWTGAALVASDALAGWTVQNQDNQVIFRAESSGPILSPGEKKSIGWLRYDHPPPLRLQITP